MSWGLTLRTALDAVRSHRLRSLLTVLGILIGIAAVILTVGLGQGAQKQVSAQIGKLGQDLLIVSPGSTTSSTGVRGGRGSASTLTTADATMLADRTVAPDIARVAPVTTSNAVLVNGTTTWTTSVVGATPDWLQVRARSLSAGRFLTSADESAAAPVAVLASDTSTELYGGRSAVGQTVRIGGTAYTVVGVLTPLGSSTSSTDDDQALVPLTTAAARVSTSAERSSVSTVYLQAKDSASLSAAYQEADAALLTTHGVSAASADFTITSQQSLVQAATATDHTLTVLLGGIAGISLLVGGIGVMNIMLVSVTERVREIGLRKALGATPAAVRRQFLVEASTLGLAGGLLGVGLGAVGAYALPGLISQPVSLSATASGGALVVALVIGVVAGVYPASRAARLAPIDALRAE